MNIIFNLVAPTIFVGFKLHTFTAFNTMSIANVEINVHVPTTDIQTCIPEYVFFLVHRMSILEFLHLAANQI